MGSSLSVIDFYRLTKVNRTIIPIAAFLLGAFFSGYYGFWVIPALLSIVFIYAAAASINDVYDFRIDRISNPQRPIPSNKIDFTGIYFVGVVLLLSGLICAYFTSSSLEKPFFMFLMLFEVVLGIIYSRITCKHFITATATLGISHGLVTFVSATYLFGNLISDEGIFLSFLIWILLFLTYNIKDFKDVEGDKELRTTLPSLLGVETAKKLVFAFLVAPLIASVITFLLFGNVLSFVISAIIGIGLIGIGIMLKRSEKKEQFTKVLRLFRLFMAGYILSLGL